MSRHERHHNTSRTSPRCSTCSTRLPALSSRHHWNTRTGLSTAGAGPKAEKAALSTGRDGTRAGDPRNRYSSPPIDPLRTPPKAAASSRERLCARSQLMLEFCDQMSGDWHNGTETLLSWAKRGSCGTRSIAGWRRGGGHLSAYETPRLVGTRRKIRTLGDSEENQSAPLSPSSYFDPPRPS